MKHITVIKRDGRTEPWQEEKTQRWAKYCAAVGADWKEISDKTIELLPETVSTEEIHETMISVCKNKKSLPYSRAASRLYFGTIRKQMAKNNIPYKGRFEDIYNRLIELGVWDKETMPVYSESMETTWEQVYPEFFECWQVMQFMDKYSLRYKGDIAETPQIAAMGIGLAIHGDTKDGHDLAKAIASGKINMPTPVLNGCRNGDFDSISCCVIRGGDSVDSIGVASHIAYKMTAKKAGIGIEYETRSTKDPVKNGRVKHLGKLPIYSELYSAVKMFTQQSRGGSATMTYRCIDPQIEELIYVKSQRTPENRRIDKIDYSFAYNDAFIEALIYDTDWHLFSIVDAPDVHKAFIEDTYTYNRVVKAALDRGANHKTMNARELVKIFLRTRQETGRIYAINLTRVNQHTPFLDPIFMSNLCVAPETQILTDKGYQVIKDLDGQLANVWNGVEFSQAMVAKTGKDQKLIKVTLSDGSELECTPYHKFYVAVGYTNKSIEKRACELESGDKLIKFNLPVINGTKHLDKAYVNGFFSGDGCHYQNSNIIYLYGEKRELRDRFLGYHTGYSTSEDQDREVIRIPNLEDKFFVPDASYTIESRLNWLSGYLDADGCVYRNGTNEQLVATSVNKEFLMQVRLMLQTLGVSAKVHKQFEAGKHLLPANDGTGELKYFDCQYAYRLLITSVDSQKLIDLGLTFGRLKIEKQTPQRDAKRFVKVESVVDEGRISDTYCFNEPKRHMGMFNGVLTGQCQEIALPNKEYIDMKDLYSAKSEGETAFCSIGAINIQRIAPTEHRVLAHLIVRTINVLIDRCAMFTESMRESINRRRSIGVGLTGVAGFLYSQGLDYDGTKESLRAVSDLAERHYYYLLEESQRLAEIGTYPACVGIDTDWLPIDTMKFKKESSLDWESMRGKPRVNSVLVAHMPAESSAVFSNSTNGLYPVRQSIIDKTSRYGSIQYIAPRGIYMKAWEVNNKHLALTYAAFQDFADQSISADYYCDYTALENNKVKMSQLVDEFIFQAVVGCKTMYYVNSNDDNGGSLTQQSESKGCESGSCSL